MIYDFSNFKGDVSFKQKYFKEGIDNSILNENEVLNRVSIFNDIASFEDLFNKDIYDFSLDEVKLLLSGLGKSEVSTLASVLSVLKEYVQFALLNKKSKYAIPSILNIKLNYLYNFVSTSKRDKKYLTRKELFSIIEKLKNFQDKALLLLIFKGVLGYQYKDLSNLRSSDLDFESRKLNYRHYYIDKDLEGNKVEFVEEKEILLTDEEAYILKAADCELEYYPPIDKNKKNQGAFSLKETEYLFKKADSNRSRDLDDNLAQQTFFLRLKWAKECFKNDMLTPRSLYIAGYVYNLLQMEIQWKAGEMTELLKDKSIGISYLTLKNAYYCLKEKYKTENEMESNYNN